MLSVVPSLWPSLCINCFWGRRFATRDYMEYYTLNIHQKRRIVAINAKVGIQALHDGRKLCIRTHLQLLSATCILKRKYWQMRKAGKCRKPTPRLTGMTRTNRVEDERRTWHFRHRNFTKLQVRVRVRALFK